MAEDKVDAAFNAVGPKSTLTMKQFLNQCLEVSQSSAQLNWLTDEQILAAGIEAWTELPLWLVESNIDAGGIFHADNRRAIDQGLEFRPLAQTIKDTLDWSRATGQVKESPFASQSAKFREGTSNARTVRSLLRDSLPPVFVDSAKNGCVVPIVNSLRSGVDRPMLAGCTR